MFLRIFVFLVLSSVAMAGEDYREISEGSLVRLGRWVKIKNARDELFLQKGKIVRIPQMSEDFCEIGLDDRHPFSTLGRRLDIPYQVVSVKTSDSNRTDIEMERKFYDPIIRTFIRVKLSLTCYTEESLDDLSFDSIAKPILNLI